MKYTKEIFINKASTKFENKFNYDDVVYIDYHTEVNIKCNNGHTFKQTPHNHLNSRGYGCPFCNGTHGDTEYFIKKSIDIHGDKYLYDKTKYINSSTKLIMTCKLHGDFSQRPIDHIRSRQGCPQCGGRLLLSNEDFINKATLVHGDRYDYSKTKYTNAKTKLKITCRIHGEFEQLPIDHMNGRGCIYCSGKYRLTTEEFIERAKTIHGDRYDYSKTIYKNCNDKLIIICKLHGEFEQSPIHHVNGCGCKKCKSSKGETLIRTFLLKNKIEFTEQKKFDDCKHIKHLPFDFSIMVNGKEILIEFDGIQHKEPHSFSPDKTIETKIKNLDLVRKKDEIRNNFCTKNNIQLIRIDYHQMNDIESILKNIIEMEVQNHEYP